MRERVIRSILIGSLWFLAGAVYFGIRNYTNWVDLASLEGMAACGGAICIGLFDGK